MDVNNEKSVEKITGLSQYLRESRHTTNWREVEILAKENNIVKRKFKESVAISQEKSYKWHPECNNYSNQS